MGCRGVKVRERMYVCEKERERVWEWKSLIEYVNITHLLCSIAIMILARYKLE